MPEDTFVIFLNAYSSLIQAIATIILVGLTAYYVSQARKTAVELEQTRKSDHLPMIDVKVDAQSPKTLDVYLKNIGRGIAQDPMVSVPFTPDKHAAETIMPGEKEILVVLDPVGTAEILELPEEERLLRVKYKDIFGRTIVSEGQLVRLQPEDGEVKNEKVGLANWRIIFPKTGE